jgi:hypothetical protein
MAWKAHTVLMFAAVACATGPVALAASPNSGRPTTSGRGIGPPSPSRSTVAPKGLGRGPSFGETVRRGSARQRPYPDQFGADTSRGNYGCHRLGKRAIDTDNTNWWVRYKACKSVGSD